MTTTIYDSRHADDSEPHRLAPHVRPHFDLAESIVSVSSPSNTALIHVLRDAVSNQQKAQKSVSDLTPELTIIFERKIGSILDFGIDAAQAKDSAGVYSAIDGLRELGSVHESLGIDQIVHPEKIADYERVLRGVLLDSLVSLGTAQLSDAWVAQCKSEGLTPVIFSINGSPSLVTNTQSLSDEALFTDYPAVHDAYQEASSLLNMSKPRFRKSVLEHYLFAVNSRRNLSASQSEPLLDDSDARIAYEAAKILRNKFLTIAPKAEGKYFDNLFAPHIDMAAGGSGDLGRGHANDRRSFDLLHNVQGLTFELFNLGTENRSAEPRGGKKICEMPRYVVPFIVDTLEGRLFPESSTSRAWAEWKSNFDTVVYLIENQHFSEQERKAIAEGLQIIKRIHFPDLKLAESSET